MESVKPKIAGRAQMLLHDYTKDNYERLLAMLISDLKGKGMDQVAAMGGQALTFGTPALAINGKLSFIGYLPEEEEFLRAIDTAEGSAPQDETAIKHSVRSAYAKIAVEFKGASDAGKCGCYSQPQSLSSTLYSGNDLKDLPDSVSGISMGCGNPVALADLREGETVLDLGSGGGLDVFLAAKQVGPRGRVIGLDMTEEMIRLARSNAEKVGYANVNFIQSEMERMNVDDGSVDVIISNCVINLSPDKDRVFKEAFRVLKPSGRMMISDIVTNGDLPEALTRSSAWSGCIAGALDEGVYLDKLRRAGFERVEIVSRDFFDYEQMKECGPPDARQFFDSVAAILSREELADLSRKICRNRIKAYKP
jgi:SAM-dependent methyltransferase